MYLMVANIKHVGKSIKRVVGTEENNFLVYVYINIKLNFFINSICTSNNNQTDIYDKSTKGCRGLRRINCR